MSEEYYGAEDTTNGNQGDSWCSMARIGWFDAHARKRFGTEEDLTYFNERIVSHIQKDLLVNTWMHERYGCDGAQQENRTMYYFEYPASVTMLLREVRYGIETRMTDITINPFGVSDFEYHIGNINVVHQSSSVAVSHPGSGLKTYKIHGLLPSETFSVKASIGCSAASKGWKPVSVVSDSSGYLTFVAPVDGSECVVSVSA